MELQIPAVHEKQRNVRPEILFYSKLLSCEKNNSGTQQKSFYNTLIYKRIEFPDISFYLQA